MYSLSTANSSTSHFLNLLNKDPRTAIHDWDFRTIRLNQGIVNLAAVKSCKNVFSGIDPCSILLNGRSALCSYNQIAVCVNGRLTFKVYTLKFITVVCRSRKYSEDLLSHLYAVQFRGIPLDLLASVAYHSWAELSV